MRSFTWLRFSGLGFSVVPVMHDLYVKTPHARTWLFRRLRKVGFDIEKTRPGNWFAKLENLERGKCGSCKQHIKLRGIGAHGHTCEKCGAVTSLRFVDGSRVRFSFIDRGERPWGLADITMTAKRWDAEEGYLYFYPNVEKGLWSNEERALEYLAYNAHLWEKVTDDDGDVLIRVRFTEPFDPDYCGIDPADIRGEYRNFSVVKVWNGVEYDMWSGDFPLPDMITIIETWDWAPLSPSPTLHEDILRAAGQTSRKDWHYQDGTPWFRPGHWEEMAKFVRHFTTLDADAFDRAWPNFRSDGPGGIDDLAAFCHPNAVVQDDPNIGNVLYGLTKVIGGGRLTPGDMKAMERGLSEPEIARTITTVLTGKR